MKDMTKTAVGMRILTTLPYYKLMTNIKKKENKTEEEIRALNSFNKTKNISLILSIIMFVLVILNLFIFGFPAFVSEFSNKRTGTIMGNNVAYTQNIRKYINIDALDIDSKNLKNGDKVILEFDDYDNLTGRALIEKDYDLMQKRNLTIFLTLFVVTIALYVISLIIIRRTIGKPFKNFILKNTCINCGFFSSIPIDTNEWTCSRCNTQNNKNNDYSAYEKKEKLVSLIITIICIIIALIIAPYYLKSNENSYLPDDFKIEIPNIEISNLNE